MRGTGRYNLALGAVATVQGIGASLSGLAAGLIVDHFGYGVAFLTSGAVAGVAFLVLALAMPETASVRTKQAWSPRVNPDECSGAMAARRLAVARKLSRS